jgi:predicted dehydrogenase
MKKLKVALVGLGEISEIHLQAFKDVGTVEVTCGSELRPDRLNHMATTWGFRGYRRFEEMLEKEKLDIVCVLTPAGIHREVTEQAAEHRINVFCEKPIAVTPADAEAMIESCRRNKVKLFYGASFRFLPACTKAREMVREGLLGDISLLLEYSVRGRGIEHYKDLGPHHYPVGGPGGCGLGLVDHGIHLVDLFSWITGSEIEYVSGKGTLSGEAPGTEFLTMIFDNGAVGQLIYNDATFPAEMPGEGIFSWGGRYDDVGNLLLDGGWDALPGNFRIHGGKGALRVFHYANKLFYFGKDRQEEIKLAHRPVPGNFSLQMQAFADSILNDHDPGVSGVDGLKALQVILAAYESFETKKVVRVT